MQEGVREREKEGERHRERKGGRGGKKRREEGEIREEGKKVGGER